MARQNSALKFLADKENISFNKKAYTYKVYSTIYMNMTHLFLTLIPKAHDENRAPPNKFRFLYCLLPIEFHGFTCRIDF